MPMMLLPSAIACDNAGASSLRQGPCFRPQALFASPPTSPPLQTTSSVASSTIFATCRALQTMLSPPSQMPTPPSSHTGLPSSFKLRLRSRKPHDTASEDGVATHSSQTRKRITKRVPPPRGVNKRRRVLEDIDGNDNSDAEYVAENDLATPPAETSSPSTPKRLRLAPEILPLGLDRSDFRSLASGTEGKIEGLRDNVGELEGIDWTNEEDRLLVELVLEKLKLTKSDWQDCARSLGKDRASVGRRWKSLMAGGEVGLKSRNKRGKLHATWR